jgi:nucleoside-diphosphate-sugar epimerase
MNGADARPIALVSGAAGNLGRSVAAALSDGYRIVGLDHGDAACHESACHPSRSSWL